MVSSVRQGFPHFGKSIPQNPSLALGYFDSPSCYLTSIPSVSVRTELLWPPASLLLYHQPGLGSEEPRDFPAAPRSETPHHTPFTVLKEE